MTIQIDPNVTGYLKLPGRKELHTLHMSVFLVLIFSLRSAGYDVQNNPGAELRRTNRRCIQARYYYVERKSLYRLQGRCKKFRSIFFGKVHRTYRNLFISTFLTPSLNYLSIILRSKLVQIFQLVQI